MMHRQKSKTCFRSERSLSHALVKMLQKRGFEPICEVPFLGRSLDVVYQRSDNSIVAIEVKYHARNAYRAITQAKYCLLGANSVYICLPKHNTSRKIRDICRRFGIGILLIKINGKDISGRYVLRARPSCLVRKHYKDQLLSSLEVIKDRG